MCPTERNWQTLWTSGRHSCFWWWSDIYFKSYLSVIFYRITIKQSWRNGLWWLRSLKLVTHVCHKHLVKRPKTPEIGKYSWALWDTLRKNIPWWRNDHLWGKASSLKLMLNEQHDHHHFPLPSFQIRIYIRTQNSFTHWFIHSLGNYWMPLWNSGSSTRLWIYYSEQNSMYAFQELTIQSVRWKSKWATSIQCNKY